MPSPKTIVDAEVLEPQIDTHSRAPQGQPCPYCGTPVDADDLYCPGCGAQLEAARPIAVARQAPAAGAAGSSVATRVPPSAAGASVAQAEVVDEEAGVRASLHERRGLLAEVLAALQRMGRNPPPALLVTPDDALASVRSAILLGAVVPGIRKETDALIDDLSALMDIKSDIDQEKTELTDAMQALSRTQPFWGWRFSGETFDCGSKLGFLAANVAIALERPDTAATIRAELDRLLRGR